MPQEQDEVERVWSLRLTQRARTDIEAAHAFLAEKRSMADADAWQEGLEDAIASLARLPERCPSAPEADLFPLPEVRQLLYRRTRGSMTYRVLFRMHETAEDAPFVRLLTLRHGSQPPITPVEARAIQADDEQAPT